ncbi:MAG TPA: hypothetical protein VMA77_05015 [Solirubrobacteraceae bacterium]|nr:hypothetical protein [Solirubrobacteraceae bacterium]
MAQAETSDTSFDSLLAEMPRIAEAVKAFPEALQAQAFEALVAEFKGHTLSGRPENTGDQELMRRQPRAARRKTQREDGNARRRRATSPTAVRDLDLAPNGQTSLRDFVAGKQPKTNHDKNAVSVYYLSEVVGLTDVTVDHVFTCYKDMRWREPGNLANSLALTANRKRFLDTASLDQIKLTPAGRNHVEHDLPPKKKGI